MDSKLVNLSYEIELQAGERLSLPDELVRAIGTGRWRITISPISDASGSTATRSHDAFLKGYAPEDEGLYDDYPSG